MMLEKVSNWTFLTLLVLEALLVAEGAILIYRVVYEGDLVFS